MILEADSEAREDPGKITQPISSNGKQQTQTGDTKAIA